MANATLGFPEDIMKLKYTNHAKERLVERTTGALIVAPEYLRILPTNSHSIIRDGAGWITDAVVRVEYKKDVKMFLCISVKSPKFAIVKTVYFKNAKKNSFKKKYERFKEDPIPPLAEYYPDRRGEESIKRENVPNVSGNMGGEKTSRWKKLFRAFWRMAGMGT